MVVDIHIASPDVRAHMCGHALSGVVYPHLCGREGDIDLLADEAVRHGVGHPVASEGHEAVRSHLQGCPPPELERRDWKRREKRLFRGEEALHAREVAACQTFAVVPVDKLGDRLVQFLQRVEDTVAQRRVDMPVHLVDGILDQGLVLRFPDSRGQRHAHVVVCQVVHSLAQVWFVAVRLLYGGLQVVRHKYPRHASEERQGPDGRIEELFDSLRTDTGYECESGERKYGRVGLYEDLRAGLHVYVRQPVSCEVNEHLLSRLIEVLEERRRLDRLDMLGYMVPELRQPVSVGMVLTVFLPEEQGGDMRFLQLLLNVGQQILQDLHPCVAVRRITAVEAVVEHRVVQ